MHVSAYDISCQYRLLFDPRMDALKKVHQRLKEMSVIKLNLQKLFPWTMSGVGKFHLAGHKLECQSKWSFNWLPGSTILDGEAAERMWATVNLFSNRTREMNPGHRHDAMNMFYSDQNVRRVHGMGSSHFI